MDKINYSFSLPKMLKLSNHVQICNELKVVVVSAEQNPFKNFPACFSHNPSTSVTTLTSELEGRTLARRQDSLLAKYRRQQQKASFVTSRSSPSTSSTYYNYYNNYFLNSNPNHYYDYFGPSTIGTGFTMGRKSTPPDVSSGKSSKSSLPSGLMAGYAGSMVSKRQLVQNNSKSAGENKYLCWNILSFP